MPLLLSLLLACAPDPADTADPLAGLTLVSEDPSDAPFDDLSDDWMTRFLDGDAAFENAFRESQGLGPAYIRTSCGGCHADDARGPGTVQKMVVLDPDGAPSADQSLLAWGHTERPYVDGGATTPITAPDDPSVLVTTRVPPAVFGRGALEAIAEADILAIAEAQTGSVSGRPNVVTCDVEANPDSLFPACTPGETALGRFGLKARQPTLDAFAADAYQGDMSITSPLRPTELDNPDGLVDDGRAGVDIEVETVNLTADYMRLLDLPSRPAPDPEAATLFEDVGCAACHVPSLRTRADWPVPQLADREVAVYTDLLLHDMGEGFSDGLTDGDAAPSEWRTAPLMGLRFFASYLHDGRASTVEEAILAHGAPGSEAADAAAAYGALTDDEREQLLVYVEGL